MLMAGNNLRTLAGEAERAMEMYDAGQMERVVVDLSGNFAWSVTVFGIGGIVYGIKRLVDGMAGVARG